MPRKQGSQPPPSTTSVSGISPEDWNVFKDRARAERITYTEALERAIMDLQVAIQQDADVDWRSPKIAPSRPVKIHEHTLMAVLDMVEKLSYRQNVIIGTAMHRWSTRS